VAGICVAATCCFFDKYIAPLLFNSRVERIHETGLPKATIENRGIYFRMKADDFFLPLPLGTRANTPVIEAGGFDWVNGTVEVRFDSSSAVSPSGYQDWVSGKLPAGGRVVTERASGGLVVRFQYFGDQ
jgi:hypothetical protein